MMTADKFSCI